ncbi:MAG: hypothetical protein ABIK09_02635 [Pseudomonadota bacterium]
MKETLLADGVDNVELWFIQIGTQDKTPEEVEDLIGEYPTTVLDDDPEQTIWTAFASTWYEAVLLDPEDCIVAKFGPFTTFPQDPDEIIPLWKGAALGTLPCDEPEPGPESGAEPAPDVSEPMPDVFEHDTVDVVDILDLVDAIEDVPTDTLADVPTDTPADLPGEIPEIPPWWCQVDAPPAPVGPGDPLPFFTCVDMNPMSPTEGEVVSKSSLKQRVWLGYAGSGG